jgi:hypothetical protein
MSLLSRRLFCILGLGWLALPGGCLSPTLPLPPPDSPNVESAGQGLVTLSGSIPEPRASVYAANDATGVYAGQKADEAGRYRFQIAAEPGDPMRLWYDIGSERSGSRPFDIPRFGLESMSRPNLVGPDADGFVTLSGIVSEPLAQVFVTNLGAGVTDDVPSDEEGRYAIQIEATSGDELELWYKFGSDFSPVIAIEVP